MKRVAGTSRTPPLFIAIGILGCLAATAGILAAVVVSSAVDAGATDEAATAARPADDASRAAPAAAEPPFPSRCTPLDNNPYAVQALTSAEKPPYLQPVRDAAFGTKLTRIAGDLGASVFADKTGTWSADARHHYYQDEPWNADESLVLLQNIPPKGGAPAMLFLDGATYRPLLGTPSNFPYRGRGDQRWHPAKAHKNEMVVSGYPSDTLYWFDVIENKVTRQWRLPFPVLGIGGGYGNTTDDGRYVLLVEKVQSNGDMRGFVIDMSDATPRIGPVYNFNDGGAPSGVDLLQSAGGNPWAAISPSGKFAVLHYAFDHDRVFTIDAGTLAIAPHPVPNAPRCLAAGANGDVLYDVGEPDFTAYGGEEFLVGQEHCGKAGRNHPGVQTVNGNGIGHVIRVNLADGSVAALTDPKNESYAFHVSARNIDEPGWVFTYYYPNHPSERFAGEIVKLSLDGKQSVRRFAKHHSLFEGLKCSGFPDINYRSEPHAVPSRDGRRLMFASNWRSQGNGGCAVQSYVVEPFCAGPSNAASASPSVP